MDVCSFCRERPQVMKIGGREGICDDCARSLTIIYDETMSTHTDDIAHFGTVGPWRQEVDNSQSKIS